MMNKQDLLQEASLTNGKNHWELKGSKKVVLSDGPNGLRIEDEGGFGFMHSKKATVFPTACSVACSFDSDLLYTYGQMLAEECQAENVDVILGPGVNTKRSPLCGRNFEYFSEDPVLSGELAGSYICGVQQNGIGTSLKHYAVNSCELGRQVVDAVIDERTLYEIYLKQFKIAIQKGHPYTLMPAYNLVNGTYCCENKKLLQQARDWGFDGIFVSDWGAVSDPVASLENGLNLEMPGPTGSEKYIVEAIESGRLKEECLHQSTRYLERFIDRCGHYEKRPVEQIKHDLFCQKAAEESIVLLKNEDVLPLDANTSLGVIGPLAVHPIIQGAGSSKVNAKDADCFIRVLEEQDIIYSYEEGYRLDTEEIDQEYHRRALRMAEKKSVVVIFAGTSNVNSGEGVDRTSLDLPFNQNVLIREVSKVCKKVIVVLQSGAPVGLPWRNQVQAILAQYYAGGQNGISLKRILFGEVNPSGHLAETWPLRNEDVPCAQYYNRMIRQAQYREGIFVGYRYYDTFSIPVAYPFGHGLSYTTYQIDDLKVDSKDGQLVTSMTVTNTGLYDGRAVIQLYIGKEESRIARAKKELKKFKSIFLKTGESKSITIPLNEEDFQYYDVQRKDWCIEDGEYQIYAGFSSLGDFVKASVHMDGIKEPYSTLSNSYIHYEDGGMHVSSEDFEKMLGHSIPEVHTGRPFTANTTVSELRACGLGKFVNGVINQMLKSSFFHGVDQNSVYNAPIRQFLWLSDHITWHTVSLAVDYLNRHGIKEGRSLFRDLKPKKLKDKKKM